MLTSKDIRTTSFETVRRGYAIEDVDAFLKKVASELDAFQTETVAMLQEKDQALEKVTREKKDLESKMIVIAEKLEEYRSQETLLQNALLNAEKMKESLLGEARQTSEILIRDAQQKAEKILESANSRVVTEEQNYLRMQQEVAKFKNKVLDIYKSHLAILNSLPNDIEKGLSDSEPVVEPVAEPVAEAVEPVTEEPVAEVETVPAEETVEETVAAVEETVEELSKEAEAVEEKVAEFRYDGFAPRVEEASTEERKSRFGNLDFGEKFNFGK